jgi:hypothetical protein
MATEHRATVSLMAAEPELDQITTNLFIWHRYDSSVKAELFSTGIRSGMGTWVIDPIEIKGETLHGTMAEDDIAGIIVTNANHARNASELSVRFGVSVHAHRDARAGLALAPEVKVMDHTDIGPNLQTIPVAGAPAGEISIFSERDGGTLVVGDALINMDGYGFTFLPPKYCEDAKLMRKSLRTLLDLQFERLVFAHGAPIISGARRRLEELLGGVT